MSYSMFNIFHKKQNQVIKSVKQLTEAKIKEEELKKKEIEDILKPASIIQNSDHDLPPKFEMLREEQREREEEYIKEHSDSQQSNTEFYNLKNDGAIVYSHYNRYMMVGHIREAFLITQYFVIFYKESPRTLIHEPIQDCSITVERTFSMSMYSGNRYRHNFAGMGMSLPIGNLIVYKGNYPIINLYGINSPWAIKRLLDTQKRLNHNY